MTLPAFESFPHFLSYVVILAIAFDGVTNIVRAFRGGPSRSIIPRN